MLSQYDLELELLLLLCLFVVLEVLFARSTISPRDVFLEIFLLIQGANGYPTL
jgi:hypothetical protein